MAKLQWVACDPRSGLPICELPGLRLKSSLSGFIGQGEGAQVELPLSDRMPREWLEATQPWRAVFVCHYDDADSTILWVGIVVKRQWGSSPLVTINLVPVEDWMDRQYVEGAWTKTEQTYIARKAGLDMVAANFNGTVVETPTGVLRQRTYKREDDMTALRACQNLMGVINGPEWMIDWTWVNGRLSVRPTIRQRLGSAWNGSGYVFRNATWTRTQDYSVGKGANTVTAVDVRQGDVRKMYSKTDYALLNQGFLPAEFRWQPNTGSTKAEILTPYAERRLADMRLGNVELDVKVHVDDLIVGKDVKLGDDVSLDLTNDTNPAIVEQSIRRLVGWTVESDMISGEITDFTPILINRDEDAIIEEGREGEYL